jgi:hypothetical protein
MTGCQGLRKFYSRYDCLCHIISTIVKRVLSKTTTIEKGCTKAPHYKYYTRAKQIFNLIDACHKLTRYFKKSACNNLLNHTLKQSQETRWNSILYMLKSILLEYETIVQVCANKNKTNLLADISKELLFVSLPDNSHFSS